MPFRRDLGLLFIHVPKTGGTSVEAALGIKGDWRVEDQGILFGQIASPDLLALNTRSPFLQHLTIAEAIAALEGVAPSFAFGIVRNPWDRLVSLYHRIDPHLAATARAQGVELQDLSFEDFVPRVLAIEHAHVAPQAGFLTAGGRVAVDCVGRFETLREDVSAVTERFGIRIDLPRVNTGRDRVHPDHRQFYSPANRTLVGNYYAIDCELFGYRF
jgi:chondroitin 4-sulfotransferase 11